MKVLVTVKPGSSKEEIVETIGENGERSLTIWTHARAHDNEANKKVIELVSDYYHVPKTSLKLVRGETSRNKVFEV